MSKIGCPAHREIARISMPVDGDKELIAANHCPGPSQGTPTMRTGRSFPSAVLAFCLLLWSGTTSHLGASEPTRAKPPPNIVFILMDDLGWRDLGCYGSTFYETPHLDRLAGQGMKFTNAYSA